MKSLATKHEFIRRRANRESYAAIADALHISKSTCSAWDSELRAEIDLQRQDNLNDLYNAYGLVKTARIERLGQTMRRIDDALADADLTQIAPEKLLELKLKYAAAMKEEYTGASEALPLPDKRGTDDSAYYATADLFQRLRDGEITTQQAKTELQTIQAMNAAHGRATNPFSDWTVGQLGELIKLSYDDGADGDEYDDTDDGDAYDDDE